MSEDRITEKVYCYDHPSAYNNHDVLAIAAMANHRDNNECWPMMAMTNGGMNNWMNNPFAYIMFLALFRNGFGGWGGDGNGAGPATQGIETQAQINAIRTQLQDTSNADCIKQAVQGNGFAISQLAQTLNIDFNTLQKCCCDVQAAIQQVAGQVGFSAERVINAVNMGDYNVIQALKDCCCQTQQLVQRMGFENQLAQKDTINAMQKGFCDLGFGMQTGFDRTNTGIERGFSQVGYETQKQTIQMVVDVTIEDGGFSRTYTMSDNISVTYANDLVLSTEREGVLREVEILKNQSSEELSKMDEYKKDVDECEKILAEWNPAFREKRETEERFSKIETSMADLKNMMAGLIKELKG